MSYLRTTLSLPYALARSTLCVAAALSMGAAIVASAQSRAPSASTAGRDDQLETAEDLFQRAKVLYQRGRHADAIALLERGLAILKARRRPLDYTVRLSK